MKSKYLSAEDRILWGRVARSTRPLAGKTADELDVELEDFAALLDPPVATRKISTESVAASPEPKRPTPGVSVMDAPTRQKIAKGRLPIEGKVDLHGLTQSEAHSLLLSFLHRAYADGRRHVLVVTGKGSTSKGAGVLRRAVPSWFSTAPFRMLVSGHEQAARHHGGEGALYVRLRRQVSS
jgi:DNA-nicking Smr family endonuclease